MPKLLDLFCGAGGCSVGYARAGFDVVGVDIEPHPDYPFPMIVADAMEVAADRSYLEQFDVVHGSPPCPAYSVITPDPTKHPQLIAPLRESLLAWGGTYVIENVEGARPYLRHPVKLCGSSFGVGVRRHRLFETNAFVMELPCSHGSQGTPWGVYGDHPETKVHLRPNTGTSRARKAQTLAHGQQLMGINWMTRWDDLTDAIPPVFTEHIGWQILAQM